MMSRILVALAILGGCLAVPAVAGQPSAARDPLSTWLRQANMTPRNRIVAFAEKMPEENYSMRPGTQTDGRTFAQYLGHVANFNYLWCSQARGEKNPNAGNDLEKLGSKAELVKAVHDAFTYCDGVYDTLTDASGMEVIDMTQENGQPTRNPRMAVLILNYGHNNEVFGDLNTFMRIKNL
jgi:hypothetical protein